MLSLRRCFAILALTSLPSLALARPQLDAARMGRLEHYDVLVFEDPWKNGIERAKAIGVFDATPEEVYRVVTDYAKWADYVPRVRASRIESRDGQGALVDMTAELPWPAGRSRVTARYQHEQLPGGIYRIRFWMVHGELRQYVGSLYIEPWAPGKTALTYELVAEPNVLAPRSTINRSIKHSAGGFVHALRQRINELHRYGYLHPQAAPDRAPSPLVGPAPQPSAIKAKADQK